MPTAHHAHLDETELVAAKSDADGVHVADGRLVLTHPVPPRADLDDLDAAPAQ